MILRTSLLLGVFALAGCGALVDAGAPNGNDGHGGTSDAGADSGSSTSDGGVSDGQSSSANVHQERITTGSEHACAITSVGGVKCWGWNQDGQLGDGTTTDRNTAVQALGLTNGVTSVSARSFHTCAVQSGVAKCWGNNAWGQLGDGTTTNSAIPVAVAGLSNVIAIAAGQSHTCALVIDGTVKCWGHNGWGQLGDGTGKDSKAPVTVAGLVNVKAIASGVDFTCALDAGGGVRCWGFNDQGELGHFPPGSAYSPVPVDGLGSGVAAITAGPEHACALLVGGAVKCWGWDHFGQLGVDLRNIGGEPASFTPVSVPLTTSALAVAAGYATTCFVTSAMGVKCTSMISIDDVKGLQGANAISVGSDHACTLLDDGSAWCWGGNGNGDLGNGGAPANGPVRVIGY